MSSWRVHCALHGVQGDPTFTECCAVLQGISALSGDGLDYQIHPVLGVQGLRDLFNSLRIDATDASNDAMLARVQCTNGVSTLERVLVNREAFLSFMRTVMERHLQGESPLSLWGATDVSEKPVIKIFVSGDRSQVGKSTVCLGLVGALLTHGGYRADEIGYIKPATQCEQPQLIAKFCRQHGIECCDIGPIVFYSGFTREFLRGNTESSTELLANARAKVEEIGRGKRVLIVDGVGYPAVGSICGVGDAIDSFNLNACFFESQGVRVLGAIFNRLPEDGFYSLANCRDSIHRYFEQFQPSKRVYGFIPELPEHDAMEDVAACCQPVTMGNRWISAVLLLAAVITTCVNEQRLIREASGLEECQRNAVSLADPVALPENDGKLVHFHGIITTDPSTLQGDPSLTRTPAQAIAQQAQHEQHAMDMEADDAVRPNFPALSAQEAEGGKNDFRRVRVPAHRYTPLKNDWPNLMTPIVDHLKLQIRMNTKTRCIELKNSPFTEDSGALQKAADFVQAYMMGFEVQDAVALLRLEDLFIDTFEVNDVKMLKGDHLSRAIGRVAGQDGKTKYAIENATRTRIVLADQKIHILGSFANIKLARDAICSLIMGAPPGKVYNKMRGVASRMNERF
ncbi:hypothetical protein P43SY_006866 [Pythium insidiosum]|uniref:K Homology domain-containing protein n=1 Tax=Pythium insidiosum TaxID=114742 RepID=A0AAD5LS06_PYTIN|nr:hypothetical protein P43SY_006866 [Pythium insidiosum]